MREFDAEHNDPELMPNNRLTTVHSIGTYHATFVKSMLRGVNRRWRYNKSTAHNLIDILYLKRLEKRLIETPTHLKTFSDMVSFLKTL